MTDKGKILAVDDTPESLRLLTDILKAEGYQVLSAISGELALRAAASNPPELVLLDIRMPGMDGFEVCRRLRAQPETRDVPVIFVSAALETDEKVLGFKTGAVDYVTKPYQRDELLARVRTHLELNRLREHLEDMVDERTAELKASEAALRLAESALKETNAVLETRIQEKLTELRTKDLLLIEQSRLASMGEMIGNIAHQWRQPLSILGLYFQNLGLDFKEGRLDERAMEDYVTKAMHIVNTISHTIDDLRSFFLPGGVAIAFDLHKAIAQAIALVEVGFSYHGITLRVSSSCHSDECNDWGFGVPNQFAQVLLNVLTNAKNILIDRNISGGMIEISCLCHQNQVAIIISDNGGGIPAEVQPRIFDPYFTSGASGTGIGLYLSKMIMDHMGGSIAAHNAGSGAEFILTLPAAPNPVDSRDHVRPC